MVSKVVLTIFVMIAVASAIPQPEFGGGWGGPSWGGPGWGSLFWGGPGWGAGDVGSATPPRPALPPWMPQWAACTTIGSSCFDCNTKHVCTKIGGLMRPCTDPTLPYCNLGECSATPSAECAPSSAPVEENP